MNYCRPTWLRSLIAYTCICFSTRQCRNPNALTIITADAQNASVLYFQESRLFLFTLIRLKRLLNKSNGVRFDRQSNRCLADSHEEHLMSERSECNSAGERVEVWKASRQVQHDGHAAVERFSSDPDIGMMTIGIAIEFYVGDKANIIAFTADWLCLTE